MITTAIVTEFVARQGTETETTREHRLTLIRKRRFKAVLRTAPLVHDDRGKPLSIVRSSWQEQKHPKNARRIAIGRWRRSAESLS